MITYPLNNSSAQVGSVKYDNNPIMRIIADNKQIYPNGIYAYSSQFPRQSITASVLQLPNILTSKTMARVSSTSSMEPLDNDFPNITKNQTINGMANYNIFRLYKNVTEGFIWVNPDASKPNMSIGKFSLTYYDGYYKENEFSANSFRWPTGHKLLRFNSMVSVNVNGSLVRNCPFYIFLWNDSDTVVNNINNGKLHTIPDGNVNFFEEKNTVLFSAFSVDGDVSYPRYRIALAIPDSWNDNFCSLELSFHFHAMPPLPEDADWSSLTPLEKVQWLESKGYIGKHITTENVSGSYVATIPPPENPEEFETWSGLYVGGDINQVRNLFAREDGTVSHLNEQKEKVYFAWRYTSNELFCYFLYWSNEGNGWGRSSNHFPC